MIPSRNRLVFALPALILFTSACGKDAPTTPTDTTATTAPATVTATASPNPVTATTSTDSAYTFAASFVATVVTTNPSPITVRAIAADLQQASGGIVITPATGTDEAFRFDVRAPGNRIDVNGNMTVPFTFFYTLPNGGREAVITLSFTVATDAGVAGTITATVNLQ